MHYCTLIYSKVQHRPLCINDYLVLDAHAIFKSNHKNWMKLKDALTLDMGFSSQGVGGDQPPFLAHNRWPFQFCG